MPYITSQKNSQNPVRIFYEDLGTGDPIVLIHGWPVSHEMWEYQITRLVEEGFRCIAYDRRGFGKSDRPWNGYDYTTLAEDLGTLLGDLALERVTLVGFSMAGGEVVRYCSKFDCERISKVVLISSIAPFMLKTDTNPDGVPLEMFDEMVRQLQNDRPAFLNTFGKHFFGVNWATHPVSADMLAWLQGLALPSSPKATLECLRSFAGTDLRGEMRSIKVPTLIIHGSGDKTVPFAPTGQQAARLIPGSLLKIYLDAPHGLFITEKEELTKDLIDFMNDGAVTDFHNQPEMLPVEEQSPF
jgi:pimeloyl-ACP methyl ester carboxylesterase